MAAPQYNAPHYKRAKAALRPDVEAGLAMCAELVCVMPTRHIPAGSRWALAHDHRDPTGMTLLGPAHAKCNSVENVRRNKPWMKTTKVLTNRRWVL